MQEPKSQAAVTIADKFYSSLLFQFILLFVALFFIKKMDIDFHLDDALQITIIVSSIVAAILTYYLIQAITKSNTTLGHSIHELTRKIQPMFSGLSWLQIIVISVLAGVGEELLFRVFLQNWIAAQSTFLIGILIASLIFGLMHALNWVYFSLTFAMGIMLGIAYHLSNSTSLVIYWHIFYDVIAIAMLAKFPHLLNIQTDPIQQQSVP